MRAADLTTLVDKAAAAKTELESNRAENMAARARKQARGEGRGKEEQAGDTGGSAPWELARALEGVEVEGARRIVPADRAVMLCQHTPGLPALSPSLTSSLSGAVLGHGGLFSSWTASAPRDSELDLPLQNG